MGRIGPWCGGNRTIVQSWHKKFKSIVTETPTVPRTKSPRENLKFNYTNATMSIVFSLAAFTATLVSSRVLFYKQHNSYHMQIRRTIVTARQKLGISCISGKKNRMISFRWADLHNVHDEWMPEAVPKTMGQRRGSPGDRRRREGLIKSVQFSLCSHASRYELYTIVSRALSHVTRDNLPGK